MTLYKLRSGYWTDKYVGYAADRSTFEVSTHDEPALSNIFDIDRQFDRPNNREIWMIAAVDTRRPGTPPSSEFYMTWAYAALYLVAPPGEPLRLGGVGTPYYPETVCQWVAHAATDGGGYYTLEAMTQPYNFLTHGLNDWVPDNTLPLGLCSQSASKVPPQDFRWYLEDVSVPGVEALEAAATA